LDVERDVKAGRRVGDPSGRGIVDAGCGDRGDVVERDAPRCFGHEAAGYQFDRLPHGGDVHVIEQHRIGETSVQHLAELMERVHLDLDLDQVTGGRLGALEHGADAAGDRDVVVLDQHSV